MNALAPHRILHRELKRKQSSQPSYSLRALARDLKISSSFLSAVLKGKKPVPAQRVPEIAKRLQMDEISVAHLKRAMALESITQEDRSLLENSHQRAIEQLSQTRPMGKSDLDLWKQWYYLPILDLSTCADFVSDVRWIARRLRIPLGDTAQAIEFLLRRGYLIEDAGVWRKADQHLRLPCMDSKEVIRNFHKQFLLKAIQVMQEQTSPEEYARRLISGMIVAANPERVAEARQKLEMALLDISRTLLEGECTELYQLGVQLYPLTRPTKG